MLLKKECALVVTFSLLILLAVPLLCAENYGEGAYDLGAFGIGEVPATSASSVSSSSSGGGSSGTSSITIERFEINPENINLKIVLENVKTREIKLKNLEDKSINLNVHIEELENFILIEDKINLEPSEEKTIEFKIVSPSDPGIYTGKIIFQSIGFKKEFLVTINTQSQDTLFDISVTIPDDKLINDKTLKAQMNLIPIGEKGVDVTIKYLIKNFKGELYYEQSETFYVDDQVLFTKNFKIDQLTPGNYILGAEMTYIGGFATASAQFEVEGEISSWFKFDVKMVFAIVIVIILGLIVIAFARYNKSKYIKKLNAIKKK